MSGKGQQTRQRILESAAEVLAAKGMAASLQDIAKVAGVPSSGVYYYFQSRDQLVQEVALVGGQLLIDAASPDHTMPQGTAVETLQLLTRTHIEALFRHGHFSRALARCQSELPPETIEKLRSLQHAYGAIWRDALEAAVAEAEVSDAFDTRSARMLILGALNSTINWWKQDGVDDLEDLIATCQQLVAGLLTATDVGPMSLPKKGSAL